MAEPLGKNLFELETSEPSEFPGGTMFRATKNEFPALRGLAVQSLRLAKGAIREPHVHPNAAQMDYCISGRARVGIIGPDGRQQLLDLKEGDVSFVPQGHVHWIENAGDEDLKFLLTLSHEEPETIELSEILAEVPKSTLASALGLSEELLDKLPEARVTIGGGSVL